MRRAPRKAMRPAVALPALAVVLAAALIVAVAAGPADLRPSEVVSSIAGHLGLGPMSTSATRDAIVWELRLPRALTAAAVGGGLALCGVTLQAVVRNPLADPYLLGLSSGASVGAVCVVVTGVALALPAAAFVGSTVALALTLAVAGRALEPTRLVLSGVAVSAALAALTSVIVFWGATGDTYRELLGWLLGSLAGSSWATALGATLAAVLIGAIFVAMAGTMDAFSLGDRTARSVGVDVRTARWGLLLAAALLTGILVSVSGSIGFVGLVVPHAARMIVGRTHRAVLPVAALLGAALVVVADTVARTAFDPRELPVGVVTAIVGAPLFALLLVRSAGARR